MSARYAMTAVDAEPLAPERLYTVEQVQRACGMGYEQLREARNSGIVTPYPSGRRDYYKGSELIAWLTRNPKKHSRDGAAEHDRPNSPAISQCGALSAKRLTV